MFDIPWELIPGFIESLCVISIIFAVFLLGGAVVDHHKGATTAVVTRLIWWGLGWSASAAFFAGVRFVYVLYS